MTCNNHTADKRLTLPTAAPDFYALLPEYIKIADFGRGSPLQALLAAEQQQANLVDVRRRTLAEIGARPRSRPQ